MRRTILIVDDNAACAEPLQIVLESLDGIDVRLVGNASEALSVLMAGGERIAAVITDLRMPSLSGLELLHIMKHDAALRLVPVVVVSGDSDPTVPAKVLDSGAAAFFTKPYSPMEVKRRLEQLLS